MRHSPIIYAAGLLAPSAAAAPVPSIDVRIGVDQSGKHGPSSFVRRIEESGGHDRRAWHFVLPDHRRVRPAGRVSVFVRAPLRERAHPEIAVGEMDDGQPGAVRRGDGTVAGTQALTKAVDILVAAADGPITLPELVARLNMPKQTCHRIATALVERGLLSSTHRSGYRLGPLFKELSDRSGG